MRFSVFGASGLFWTLRKSLRDSTQAPTAATTTRATISDRNHPSKVPHPIEERLNSRGETRHARGLVLCDSSVFPTSCGVNPMLSVMTMARYQGLRIAAEFARYEG
jgi:hypothetical protein